MSERSLSLWTIRVKVYTNTKSHNKTPNLNNEAPTQKHLKTSSAQREKAEGNIEVHIRYVQQLLTAPKTLRNQVLCEAAFLQALRSGEISSLRREWLDFETGYYQLLDSKKNMMFTRPMEIQFAKHTFELIQETGNTKGILIQPLPDAPHTGRKQGSKTPGEGLSTNYLADIIAKCCVAAGVPIMTPRIGRANVAVKEHFFLGKPAAYIQWLLRHDNLQSTEHYLSKIVCYEDMKTLFFQGKESPFYRSECGRSDSCPLSAPGCCCRMFQESVKVQQP